MKGIILKLATLLIHKLPGLAVSLGVAARTRYDVECYGPDGTLKWADHFYNLVVNTGLDDLLDKRFKASAYTSADFVGLTSGTPSVAAADTMASHGGWTEITAYSQGTRPSLTLGTVSGQSVDNSASKAVFSINGTATVGGCFVTTDSTKGGTAGILYGAGAFSQGNKSVNNGDTLNVTVTLTTAAA